jgi:hypothetical protein
MISIIFTATRIGHPILGFIIPAFILIISIVLTFKLIRYFSKNQNSD